MSYIEIVLLALALSVDAFAVSFSYGIAGLKNRRKGMFSLALFTGVFQGLMPLLGYYFTGLFANYLDSYAKYIVFGIFTILGIKFIIESFSEKEDNKSDLNWFCLLMIGIGTSIDAFSAGISLLLCGNRILKPVLLIGVVTFINSAIGFKLGEKAKKMSFRFPEIISGVVLILIGINNLLK